MAGRSSKVSTGFEHGATDTPRVPPAEQEPGFLDDLRASGKVMSVGEGWNGREATGDPTAHAEIVALRAAARALGDWNLTGCTIAVTVEPCTMCAGAITLARLDRVVFGCWEPKTGAAGSLWDVLRDRRLTHRAEVRGGVLADECAALLQDFFAAQRAPG